MVVSAVHTYDKNSNASYIKAAGIGALAGYSSKYILPVFPHEKKDDFNLRHKEAKERAKEAHKREVESIRNAKPKTKAGDVFVKLHDQNKLNSSEISKIKPPKLAEEVAELHKGVGAKVRIILQKGRDAAIAVTKSVRKAQNFIAIGVVAGLSAAFIYNIINRITTYETED